MKLSILIPTYNRLEYLKLSLKSIMEEAYGLDHEVIILNHGSTDGTKEWLDTVEGIRVIHWEHNRHPSQGDPWQHMLSIASGEYVILWADDDIHRFNSLRYKLSELDADPSLAFVHGSALRMDLNGNVDTRVNHICHKEYLSFGDLIVGNCVMLQTVIGRTDLIRKHWIPDGPLSDWRIWLSILHDGGRCKYLPQPSVNLRLWPGSDSVTSGITMLTDLYKVWGEFRDKGWEPTAEQIQQMRMSACAQAIQLIR